MYFYLVEFSSFYFCKVLRTYLNRRDRNISLLCLFLELNFWRNVTFSAIKATYIVVVGYHSLNANRARTNLVLFQVT